METGAISTALPAIQCGFWRISFLCAKKAANSGLFKRGRSLTEDVFRQRGCNRRVFSDRLIKYSRFQKTQAGDGFDSALPGVGGGEIWQFLCAVSTRLKLCGLSFEVANAVSQRLRIFTAEQAGPISFPRKTSH